MNDEKAAFTDFLRSPESRNPFTIGIIAFQIVWLVITAVSIYTKRFRLVIAGLSAGGAFLSETLNSKLSKEWQYFGLSRNLFDDEGFFMFLVWAMPLTLDLFFIVLSLLTDLCNVLALHYKMRTAIEARRSRSKAKQT